MSLRRLLVEWNCRTARPESTPTAVSLVSVGILLVMALAAPDVAVDRAAAAGETGRVALTPAKPQRPISLRDRLVVGLQARTQSEVAFVETVAARVRTGHLPQRVVDETFFWARSRAAVVRNGRARRPIIYFQPAMVARAQRLRVNL